MCESKVVHRWRTCEYKKAFNLEEVKKQCKRYGLYYYKCPYCGKYHTTKQLTYESIMDTEEE